MTKNRTARLLGGVLGGALLAGACVEATPVDGPTVEVLEATVHEGLEQYRLRVDGEERRVLVRTAHDLRTVVVYDAYDDPNLGGAERGGEFKLFALPDGEPVAFDADDPMHQVAFDAAVEPLAELTSFRWYNASWPSGGGVGPTLYDPCADPETHKCHDACLVAYEGCHLWNSISPWVDPDGTLLVCSFEFSSCLDECGCWGEA